MKRVRLLWRCVGDDQNSLIEHETVESQSFCCFHNWQTKFRSAEKSIVPQIIRSRHVYRWRPSAVGKPGD